MRQEYERPQRLIRVQLSQNAVPRKSFVLAAVMGLWNQHCVNTSYTQARGAEGRVMRRCNPPCTAQPH
ncbi:hypothetical protein E2C01_044836 [Portunus trituberculatus]|uniref:Uncharacterized protein n=1 Tax=Portunus trituberculatus TaxID=210409 RepID=A0A5B7G0I8_PORTR|nr:hypothetical protein [Portunus trituberculatus]